VIRVFRITAIIEAVTWGGLLVSMFFNYVLGAPHRPVWLMGTLHGYAMCAYVLAVFLARAEFGWSWRATLIALAASVPPFATLPAERWAAAYSRRLADERRVAEAEGQPVVD